MAGDLLCSWLTISKYNPVTSPFGVKVCVITLFGQSGNDAQDVLNFNFRAK
jgi:hypothetical protein